MPDTKAHIVRHSLFAIIALLSVLVGCKPLITTSEASPPVFTPSSGTYSADLSVTIEDKVSGAVIHYTTDGSTPSAASPEYRSPILLSGDKTSWTVKAIAEKDGMHDSAVVSASYQIHYMSAEAPSFSPAGGTCTPAQVVAISCAADGASIRYTTDGSDPSSSSTAVLYTEAISLAALGPNPTIQAVADVPGDSTSAISRASFQVVVVYEDCEDAALDSHLIIADGSKHYTFPDTNLSRAGSGSFGISLISSASDSGWGAFLRWLVNSDDLSHEAKRTHDKSIGFWYYTPELFKGNFVHVLTVHQFDPWVDCYKLEFGRSNTDGSYSLGFSLDEGGLGFASAIKQEGLMPHTWYWIAVEWVQGTGATLRVYDGERAYFGTASTDANKDAAGTTVQLGITYMNQMDLPETEYAYYDEIKMTDETYWTYPLQ